MGAFVSPCKKANFLHLVRRLDYRTTPHTTDQCLWLVVLFSEGYLLYGSGGKNIVVSTWYRERPSEKNRMNIDEYFRCVKPVKAVCTECNLKEIAQE